ncbi:hypothetical protein FKM82_014197 [Ascaphus truei]
MWSKTAEDITTAVKFLQNPKVRQSPVSTRKEFLKRKGLSDEEIELALQQSGTAHDDPPPQGATGMSHPGPLPQLALQPYSPPGSRWREYGALAIILAGIAFGFHQLYKRILLPADHRGREIASSLQRIDSGVSEMKRQFPPSPSAPKIPAWQIPLKPATLSSPATLNHNSSSDISPVSNESGSSSPVKENHSPEGSKVNSHHLVPTGEEEESEIDVQGQVRMEVQGEEEEEEEDVGQIDEEDCIGVQTEDRRGGDGQINEPVEKLRRPEGASNEMD